MIGYVAKDKSGVIYFHYEEPTRDVVNEWWWSNDDAFTITNKFPQINDITWEDKPVKVEITIKRI